MYQYCGPLRNRGHPVPAPACARRRRAGDCADAPPVWL